MDVPFKHKLRERQKLSKACSTLSDCIDRVSDICETHYNDVIMNAMASQITSLAIVYSSVYSGVDQRTHQSSASLAFVRGIHRWPAHSPGQQRRKCFHMMTSSWGGTCLQSVQSVWQDHTQNNKTSYSKYNKVNLTSNTILYKIHNVKWYSSKISFNLNSRDNVHCSWMYS